jgi:para-nitrobenzyl esterase
VRTADAYGNACIQVPGLSEANGGYPGSLSEDCLYLNVWSPKLDPAAKLPVLVWIHGGAYVFGSGGLTLYNGAPLAAKGAVVITINYRLAQLGFFARLRRKIAAARQTLACSIRSPRSNG